MTLIPFPDSPVPAELAPVMMALATVSRQLRQRMALGPLEGDLAASVGANTDGDTQKALDVIADEAFLGALPGTGIRWYASEERESVVGVDPAGTLALAIDPLDGSSNIDVNGPVGTIFSLSRALEGADETFLRPAQDVLAAGYVIYSAQTVMVVSFGKGVRHFVLDDFAGAFREVAAPPAIAANTGEFAINASNYRHWPKAIRAFIDDMLAGVDGPRGKNFNMRWLASLVGEAHRILCRGGVFLYPSDARPGYEQGRLRLVYEGVPIAFLVEQAGGRATDGLTRILDKTPASLHARTALVFGAAAKVAAVASYHDLSDDEVSALFGNRGLFRA